jgi:outer membrane protein TolC
LPVRRGGRSWNGIAAVVGAAIATPPFLAPADAAPALGPGLPRLERNWRDLDRELRALDALISPDPQPPVRDVLASPLLPRNLLNENKAPEGPLSPADRVPPAPLSLPAPPELRQGRIASLQLAEAVVIAFANNPGLQAQRLEVAAALAELQASLGSYWPRIHAFADAATGRSGQSSNAPVGNTRLGLGPNFAPGGPFAVPSGGAVGFGTYASGGAAGVQLDYALLDFARTPAVRAARSRLSAARSTYANQLRLLQLQVSEAYYQLQQADQNVRIQDAAVRNDLVILQEALDLKQAGLVPRLDVLRRRAIEAADQEALIEALAGRAIARRELAVLLNLPVAVTPTASDPITPSPAWPFDLETSLLAAYRGNPELEAILATREALARERDAAAASLLPKLSLFASGSGNTSNTNNFNLSLDDGGCCGTTFIPVQNSSGGDWSLGLSLRWLLFDGGSSSGQARALALRARASEQQLAARRDAIRLRLETAFLTHEASLARLSAARRGVAAALEAFRDVRLRYQSGLSSEVDVSVTQDQLIRSLIRRLNATVAANVSYARLLRELLPVPRDPSAPFQPLLRWPEAATRSSP